MRLAIALFSLMLATTPCVADDAWLAVIDTGQKLEWRLQVLSAGVCQHNLTTTHAILDAGNSLTVAPDSFEGSAGDWSMIPPPQEAMIVAWSERVSEAMPGLQPISNVQAMASATDRPAGYVVELACVAPSGQLLKP